MATKAKPYTAKTLSGAQRRVRELEKLVRHLDMRLGEYQKTRRWMAMLAAEGPCFDNPLIIAEATEVRDRILRNECRRNPDGTPLTVQRA